MTYTNGGAVYRHTHTQTHTSFIRHDTETEERTDNTENVGPVEPVNPFLPVLFINRLVGTKTRLIIFSLFSHGQWGNNNTTSTTELFLITKWTNNNIAQQQNMNNQEQIQKLAWEKS